MRKHANCVSLPQVSKTVASLKAHFKILKLDVQQKIVDPMSFVMKKCANTAALIDSEITNQGISRVGLCLQVKLLKPLDADTLFTHFSSRLMRVVESIDDEKFDELLDQVLRQLNVCFPGGSSWVLEKLICLDIKFCKTNLLAGSCYLPIPAKLFSLRRSSLIIRNLFDNFCFIYCLLAFLYPPKQNHGRPSMYKDKFNRLILEKSSMPMELSDIAPFEKKNQLS